MIRNFLEKKYSKDVTSHFWDTEGFDQVWIKNDETDEGQIKVMSHLKSLVNSKGENLIPKKFFENDVKWGLDFSAWIGELNIDNPKEFLFIGAEPHIKCNFQLVYGFGCYEYGIENTVKHHFKDEKNIWYNLANVFVEDCTEIDNVTNFLKKCYITDLCHIVPQDCGQVKDICKKLSIKNSDWGNFRKQVAIEFLFKEIAVVKPKFIILHGDPSRKFFKQYLNERIHPIECSNLKILEGKIEIEGNEYKIISIPHLAGQMKNELWRSHKYPKRPKSAKEIIRKLVYDKC